MTICKFFAVSLLTASLFVSGVGVALADSEETKTLQEHYLEHCDQIMEEPLNTIPVDEDDLPTAHDVLTLVLLNTIQHGLAITERRTSSLLCTLRIRIEEIERRLEEIDR